MVKHHWLVCASAGGFITHHATFATYSAALAWALANGLSKSNVVPY